MKHYNKLVRDSIPNLIEREGRTVEFEILSPERFHEYLDDKLQEEFEEFLVTRDHLELMDIVEVVQAIVECEGGDWEAFEGRRAERREERGGFRKRVWRRQAEHKIRIYHVLVRIDP